MKVYPAFGDAVGAPNRGDNSDKEASMTKLDTLMQTNELQTCVDALCEAQDAATMQILAMATLARAALDGGIEGATDHVGHVLDAIRAIAAAAAASLDAAQIEISDARIRDAVAREVVACGDSPLESLSPLEES